MGNDEHIWFHFFGATTARCNFKHEVSVTTTWGNLHRDLTLLCPLYLRSFTPVLPLSSVISPFHSQHFSFLPGASSQY